MQFLLDSNCWLHVIGALEFGADVRSLLQTVPPPQVALTDFALHSIGVVMRRHRLLHEFPRFIHEMRIGRLIRLINVDVTDIGRVADACRKFDLDFDDGYQYVAADLNDFRLVSLDADFDRTPLGRLTPAAALQLFKDQSKP